MERNHLYLYRIFNEVAKTGNFTNAAKELYLSQPAVSSAINNLEATLKTKLFVRKSRGVELTNEGRTFYNHIKSAFHILEKGTNEVMKESTSKKLSIGVSTTMCHHVVRPFLKDFIEEFPHLDISLLNQSSFETYKMLESYELDIGIVTASPLEKKDLKHYLFMSIEFIFVATPSYLASLEGKDAKSLEDYFELGKIMMLNKVHPLRQSLDHTFYKRGIKINNKLEVSNMDLLIDFAKMGIGIGFVIRNFVKDQLDNGELVELALEIPQVYSRFALVYNEIPELTGSSKIFIEKFKEKYKLIN